MRTASCPSLCHCIVTCPIPARCRFRNLCFPYLAIITRTAAITRKITGYLQLFDGSCGKKLIRHALPDHPWSQAGE
ncbi:predicted protein [Brucella pinnipedialis M292/94/1]|uniref:Uncharacterized protein n=1 Tax=Brucella pinnipedialis M292/94/1 TaxID=520462 RepID=A0A0E1WYW5_9HYPH|nr:predicted protein [Brucella pinnipedialis M292/94/1]